MSPPTNEKLYFFCSCLIDLTIFFILCLFIFFFNPEKEISKNLGSADLQIISDIDDLIIFFINKSGYRKFK